MKTDEDVQYRISYLESINNKIFDLIYYGKFSFLDCENMTSVELKWFHSKLVKTKSDENKSREEAMKRISNSSRNFKNINSQRVSRSNKVRRR